MTSARRELMLSAVFLDFCSLSLATGLQLVKKTYLCWCHRCAIFSVLAELMFNCAPALWILMQLSVWRVEMLCAGKITSASAKPGPSALSNDAHCRCFSDQHSNSHILRAPYISDTSRSLPLCYRFRRAQKLVSRRQHSNFAVSGRRLTFRSDLAYM